MTDRIGRLPKYQVVEITAVTTTFLRAYREAVPSSRKARVAPDVRQLNRDDLEVVEGIANAKEALNTLLNRARARQLALNVYVDHDDNGTPRVVADVLRPMRPTPLD